MRPERSAAAALTGGVMEKHKVVREAYIYGYPLVTMDMTRRQETNVRVPDEAHAPMGQLIKLRAYPAVDNRGAAAPNADTLYTMVWLDVSDGPWVFSIPDMGHRFYIMPMLSGYRWLRGPPCSTPGGTRWSRPELRPPRRTRTTRRCCAG